MIRDMDSITLVRGSTEPNVHYSNSSLGRWSICSKVHWFDDKSVGMSNWCKSYSNNSCSDQNGRSRAFQCMKSLKIPKGNKNP
jgi:hypothetical protein